VTFEQLIEQQQPHVERVIHDLARRYFLASAEIEEFRAVVAHALERNDFELLRAFDGKSTWETYLRTVITREFMRFRTSLWGAWRPTSLARRLGPAATLLEELMVRDGFTLPDATEWMRTTHRVDLSRHRIAQLAEELGLAGERRPASAGRHDEALRRALTDALALLVAEDRLIIELRCRDGAPFTRIASLLKTDVRPVQRRLEAAKAVLGESLRTQGVAAADVESLMRCAEGEGSERDRRTWEIALARPSTGSTPRR
jgi:DNA-directed RNA polymerase specialized sigma24 family protein